MSAWRKSVLEADAKYAGIASEDTSHPQAIIFNWKAGLQPLSVWYVWIGYSLNEVSQQRVEGL